MNTLGEWVPNKPTSLNVTHWPPYRILLSNSTTNFLNVNCLTVELFQTNVTKMSDNIFIKSQSQNMMILQTF